ncbi:MAG TPA: mechanosensitive ion channel family protein [Firmicutes bacterium]|nr:mechanosensitive ion channel family protein [Bacillota bacterium]
MMSLTGMLNQVFFHNRLLDYLIFGGILIIGAVVARVLNNVLIKRLYAWAESTPGIIDDFLVHTLKEKIMPFLYYGLLIFAVQFLHVAPVITKGLNLLGIVLLTFYGVRFFLDALKLFLKNYWLKKAQNADKQHIFDGIFAIVKLMIWGFAFLLLLDNLGVKISTLVTGLGIGGVAVALAAQTILGDLFNYFTIYFDRPFEVGDYIIVGEYRGTVEHIGLKTTRLRSLGGEQLILANTDLTNSRVRNYKRMERRRVVFNIRVAYTTDLQRLRLLSELLTEIVKNMPETTFDRAHFAEIKEDSFVFEVVYYVNSRDYRRYMDIQQEINLQIAEKFAELGVEFAYPTHSLYLQKTPEAGLASANHSGAGVKEGSGPT